MAELEINEILLIGLGGFIGAILRYAIGGLVPKQESGFPLGTLSVNVLGSFILSTILFLSEHSGIVNEKFRIFTTIGLLGALTTMSTFSYESLHLMDEGKWLIGIEYVLITVFATLLAVFAGKVSAEHLFQLGQKE